ncbi:hypothetical protein GW7_01517 [Heterocephalus glaber]|uniref:Uncharacterized protein n=1 Tax=Heterocephalus glaber TaxID=10181 RepID=G5BSP2_HETGA|nr:hypothetical protein GW7_01517 [Heterocephalus glaber]
MRNSGPTPKEDVRSESNSRQKFIDEVADARSSCRGTGTPQGLGTQDKKSQEQKRIWWRRKPLHSQGMIWPASSAGGSGKTERKLQEKLKAMGSRSKSLVPDKIDTNSSQYAWSGKAHFFPYFIAPCTYELHLQLHTQVADYTHIGKDAGQCPLGTCPVCFKLTLLKTEAVFFHFMLGFVVTVHGITIHPADQVRNLYMIQA